MNRPSPLRDRAPFVHRLGHQPFKLERRVRFSYGVPSTPVGRVVALLLLVAALPIAVTPGTAGEEGPADTRRLLKIVRQDADADADAAAWSAAVARLRAGTEAEREALGKLLRKMAMARARRLRSAVAKVNALAGKVSDGRRVLKARRAWEEARQRATDWIFDLEAFPVPVQAVITGPQEGYRQAKERGDVAQKTWKILARHLDRELAPALSLSTRKARRLRRERLDADAAFRRVAGEIESPPTVPSPDRYALRLLDARCGDLAAVVAAYAALEPGWRKLCLYHVFCAAVSKWNEAHEFDMRKGALAGIRGINALRIPLGISPVLHDPRLVAAAAGHSLEMTRRGFFSHRSPTPGRETKEKRARREGYGANVVECITAVGGGMAAVEFWRYDGGHHRDMVDPEVVEAGFSTRGPAVYLGGKGAEGHLPGIRYGD